VEVGLLRKDCILVGIAAVVDRDTAAAAVEDAGLDSQVFAACLAAFLVVAHHIPASGGIAVDPFAAAAEVARAVAASAVVGMVAAADLVVVAALAIQVEPFVAAVEVAA